MNLKILGKTIQKPNYNTIKKIRKSVRGESSKAVNIYLNQNEPTKQLGLNQADPKEEGTAN